ncbi:MAG: ABC transporter substrate-binding protein [Acidimicrobiales bacterium]
MDQYHEKETTAPRPATSKLSDERRTRREFLGTVARGAVVAGAGVGLSAYGWSEAAWAQERSLSGQKKAGPKRGGTLNVGLTGGASSDTLNPLNPLLNIDFARVNQLFEPLIAFTPEAGYQLWLAEEVTPNRDATSWTIRVRDGITFHNGKTLSADDVIYTLQQIRNPKNVYGGASQIASLDIAGIKRLDRRTVSIPCSTPFSTFDQVLPCYYFPVVPVGFDEKKPVGTGPFVYKSFTPGVSSEFIRNNNYWVGGKPYLDRVVISDYSDEVSQLDSLQSGAADAIGLLSAVSVATARSSGQVVISKGGGWTPFTMRVDQPPFNDVRVRQAMRYAIDRRQMLELVFEGYGTVGNDLFAIWDTSYDHGLPQRPYDPERAKSLLKAAGRSDLSTVLVTSSIAQGTVNAAEVLAQQVKKSGISVSLQRVTPTSFYGPNYLKWTFAQDYWYYNPYVPQVGAATVPVAPTNETHFDDPRYNSLYAQALATVDLAKRTEIIHEMQTIEYDSGGYIIPYFPPVIDAYAKNVRGTESSKIGVPMNNYDLKQLWFD